MSLESWLATVPPALQDDIASCSDILSPSLLSLRTAIGSTVSENLHLLLSTGIIVDALDDFLRTLETQDIARKWTPAMTTGRGPLKSNILKLRNWLIDDFSDPCATPARHACCRILESILNDPTAMNVLRTMFEVFSSPPDAQTSQLEVAEPDSQTSQRSIEQTPVKRSSCALSQHITHAQLDPLIRKELDLLVYPDTPNFYDVYFPRQEEAFNATASKRIRRTWKYWPATPTQDAVFKWFQATTESILSPNVLRKYYTSEGNALSGSLSARKTDILLYPTSDSRKNAKGIRSEQGVTKYAWQDVLVVGELKQNTNVNSGELIIQVAGYAREIFSVQHNRRFVHAFTLTGDILRTWIFHRGGAFGSEAISINQHPDIFVNVFYGYAMMNQAELGYDTTLTFDSFRFKLDGCNEDIFRIVKKAFFARKAIASRGTTCWDAQRKGDASKYVLKDSWRSIFHTSEFKLLQQAKDKGVQGLVEFLAYEEVMIKGKVDTIRGNIMSGLQVGKPISLVKGATRSTPPTPATPTDLSTHIAKPQSSGRVLPIILPRTRSGSSQPTQVSDPTGSASFQSPVLQPIQPQSVYNFTRANPPEFDRVHTRLLMRKGRDIWEFGTPKELLLGFHDAIECHRSLYENAGILHRDISIFNIMLSDPEDPRDDGKTGFLIDLDLAIELASVTASGSPHRTGTPEFMAVEELRQDQWQHHTYRHDLESFWYVFIWICVCRHWSHHGVEWSPLVDWGCGSMDQVADKKEINVRYGNRKGYQTIEACFGQWAVGLKEVAESWRRVMFPIQDDGNINFGTPSGEEGRVRMYDAVMGHLQSAAEIL